VIFRKPILQGPLGVRLAVLAAGVFHRDAGVVECCDSSLVRAAVRIRSGSRRRRLESRSKDTSLDSAL